LINDLRGNWIALKASRTASRLALSLKNLEIGRGLLRFCLNRFCRCPYIRCKVIFGGVTPLWGLGGTGLM